MPEEMTANVLVITALWQALAGPGLAPWPTWLFWGSVRLPSSVSVTASYIPYYIIHGVKNPEIYFSVKWEAFLNILDIF